MKKPPLLPRLSSLLLTTLLKMEPKVYRSRIDAKYVKLV